MNAKLLDDIGKFLLRLTCGGLLFFHGWFKVFGDIEHVKKMVVGAGLPSFLAYGTIVGEFIAPLLLIIGWKSRIWALIIAFNMLMSIIIGHRDIAFKLNDFGAWMIELNVFFMMAALALVFLGAGRFSLSRGKGRWD